MNRSGFLLLEMRLFLAFLQKATETDAQYYFQYFKLEIVLTQLSQIETCCKRVKQ